MVAIMNWVEARLLIPNDLQFQIAETVFIILFMTIFYLVIKRVLYRVIKDNIVYYRTKKSILYITFIMIFILIGRIWLEGIESLATFIGIFSAALAIVMKDVILNIAGWVYMILKSPFRVGDRIEIDGVAGDVIDIQLFSFAMMEIKNWIDGDQSTGRIVYMPNVIVFNKNLFNYGREIPFIWDEIPVRITFESNWKKAKSILTDIAYKYGEVISEEAEESIKEASKKFSMYNAQLKPIVYTKIDHNDPTIVLTLRYMCAFRKRRGSSDMIYEEILEEFSKHADIRFSYPVRITYKNEEFPSELR